MKTSMKSLTAVVALAAAGLANAHPISGGWDREGPPNFVDGNWIDINQDWTQPCVASFWGLELSVASFTAFGNTFTNPVWSTGAIADCAHLPDDMVPMGPLGGPSGLDGTYRMIWNLNGYPNCSSGAALTLTSGSSTAAPDDWSCAQVVVRAAIILPPSTPEFKLGCITVTAKGIDGVATNTLTWDLY